MREVLFRGKRVDNGEWTYGYYVKADHHWHEHGIHKDWIICTAAANGGWFVLHEKHAVIPSTIGQYTGLKDKNGKRIFEGDIFPIEDEIIAIVIFTDGGFRLEEWGFRGTFTESGYDECGNWGKIECEPIDWYIVHHVEVIGNIHDNPELLGGNNG